MQPIEKRPEPAPISPEILAVIGDPAHPTRPLPFNGKLGHLPGRSGIVAGVQNVVGMMRNGEGHFATLIQKYGPVFRHMIGSDPVVLVADPELIWTMVRNEDEAWSTALAWSHLVYGLDLLGLGVLDRAPHRHARALFQPALAAPALAGYIAAAQTIFTRTIDEWMQRGRISFKSEARSLMASVSARVFMGIEDPAQGRKLDRAMSDGWQSVLAILPRSKLSFTWRRAERGLAEVWKIMRSRPPGGDDLLSRLREAREEADWLDDETTRMKLFLGLMMAAFDTTANAVGAMGYLLAKHPDWQEKLREEALALTNERPAPEELKKLDRIEWGWKETLRLFPVGGQLPRQTLRETQLGDFRIPAGTTAWALIGSAMRDPKYWTDPLQFDPARFSPERAEDKRHKALFLPFGAGPHACLGAQLSTLEAKAFWHAFLRRCRFKLRRDYPARHLYLPLGHISGDVELELEPI